MSKENSSDENFPEINSKENKKAKKISIRKNKKSDEIEERISKIKEIFSTELERENVYYSLARVIGEVGNPSVTLAIVVHELIKNEILDDFGISMIFEDREIGLMLSNVLSSANIEEICAKLEVNALNRINIRKIKDLLKADSVREEREREVIAIVSAFALENEIYEIEHAYRVYKAENKALFEKFRRK